MSEDRISVIEASRLFQVTYSTLFNRSKTHKQGAPVLYHENGAPYYLLSEVKQLLKEQKEFEENFIKLSIVSKKCFNSDLMLKKYFFRENLTPYFDVTIKNKELYVPISQYHHFYINICENAPLVTLAEVLRKLGLYRLKGLEFLKDNGFFERGYFSFKMGKWHRIFFKRAYVKNFFKEHQIQF